jgi:hypothetical protein
LEAEALGVLREKVNETVSAVLERLGIGMSGSKKADREEVASTVGYNSLLGTGGQGSSVAVAVWQPAGTRTVHAQNALRKDL